MLNDYIELSTEEKNNILFKRNTVCTTFGNRKSVYADFIASGLASPFVEEYIKNNIYSKYSNTHSNSTNGICMKDKISDTRKTIRTEYNLDDSYKILFKGFGCTDCINFLLNCLDYTKYFKVFCFISMYEHYSNHLPFIELTKTNKNIELIIIPIVLNTNELDVEWFAEKIKDIEKSTNKKSKTLILTSVIHCSNLTGYYLPISKIKQVIDKIKHKQITKYLFVDAACSAPYDKIDGSLYDAMFIAPHKFIGGVSTPGLLIAKTCLFEKDHPMTPGGSCVKSTKINKIVYSDDIEVRESSGTPNIIGIIKIGKALSLKKSYYNIIENNERVLSKLVNNYKKFLKQKFGDARIFTVDYADNIKRMPILSFSVKNAHHNLIVVLLNDIFGIQVRGGKMCVGILNDYFKNLYDNDGFCRVSFHWTMSKCDIIYILNAIEYVIEHCESFKQYYYYKEEECLFYIKPKYKNFSGIEC
jgi:selenocysteine lyase/cysteine desulfurase